MVLQAKLERRHRRQLEKSHHANNEAHDGSLSGHLRSIPPPSEPVIPAGNKVLSPKAANGSSSSQIVRQAGETVPEQHIDIHNVQSQSHIAEDKSEARHSTAIHNGN